MYKSRVGLSASVTSYFTLAVRLGGLAPTLSLDFLSGSLDSRITFSRGSNATLVDSTGKVTYAPNNLLTYSEQFDNAAWTKDGVTIAANSTAAPDGTLTADTLADTTANAGHLVYESAASITSGTTYTFSVFAKASTATVIQVLGRSGTMGVNVWANFNLSNGTIGSVGSSTTASITDFGGGWYRCIVTGTATGTGTGAFALSLTNNSTTALRSPTYIGTGTGTFIWGAQLEAVTYQTTPSTYNATTASAYYGPRFDYDPVTRNPKGLLIEEQRSNLLTYSQEFDNAAWTKTNATVTANSATAPDGTSTADSLIENTVNGVHDARRSVTASALTTYTQSIFVKASGRTRGQMQMFGNSGGSTINYDLTAGTATAAGAYGGWTGASATITNYGNGWYRITNTATTNAGLTSLVAAYFLADASGSASYTGDGTSGMLYWGAQVEAGAFATSYIPTVASTVTRSADVALMQGANFSSWYNQSEGTFSAEIDTTWSGVADATRYTLAFDGSASKRIVYIGAGANAASNYDGTNILNATGTITPGPSKIASAYGGTTKQIVSNGGTVASGAFAGWVAPASLNIGSLGSSTNVICGHIRRLAYYPTRLANATLQRLTA